MKANEIYLSILPWSTGWCNHTFLIKGIPPLDRKSMYTFLTYTGRVEWVARAFAFRCVRMCFKVSDCIILIMPLIAQFNITRCFIQHCNDPKKHRTLNSQETQDMSPSWAASYEVSIVDLGTVSSLLSSDWLYYVLASGIWYQISCVDLNRSISYQTSIPNKSTVE